MSITYTPRLGVPRIDRDAPLLAEQFNDAIDAIDGAALPAAHEPSAAHFDLWQPRHAYAIGDVFRVDGMQSWGFWEVTAAGVSGTVAPIGHGEGDTATDGAATVKLRRMAGAGAGFVSALKAGSDLVLIDGDGNRTTVPIGDDSGCVKSVAASPPGQLTITKGDGTSTAVSVSAGVMAISGSGPTITARDANGSSTAITVDNVSHAVSAANDANGKPITGYLAEAADVERGKRRFTRGGGTIVDLPRLHWEEIETTHDGVGAAKLVLAVNPMDGGDCRPPCDVLIWRDGAAASGKWPGIAATSWQRAVNGVDYICVETAADELTFWLAAAGQYRIRHVVGPRPAVIGCAAGSALNLTCLPAVGYGYAPLSFTVPPFVYRLKVDVLDDFHKCVHATVIIGVTPGKTYDIVIWAGTYSDYAEYVTVGGTVIWGKASSWNNHRGKLNIYWSDAINAMAADVVALG